jgi:hypothetical protein
MPAAPGEASEIGIFPLSVAQTLGGRPAGGFADRNPWRHFAWLLQPLGDVA